MKHLIPLLLAITLAVALAAPNAYQVSGASPAMAEFNFRVTLIPVPGKTSGVEAKLNLDPSDLSKTSGTVSVDLTKIETGIGLRDQHAKDALGAEQFPKAIFTLQRYSGPKTLEPGKDVTASVEGKFDLKGITTPLKAPITLRLDGNRILVTTSFNVALADHNISVLGADPITDVKVSFALENAKP